MREHDLMREVFVIEYRTDAGEWRADDCCFSLTLIMRRLAARQENAENPEDFRVMTYIPAGD